MAIVGIGVDVVDIERFTQTLERTPGLRERLFVESELAHRPASLAARFAAKEALAKALSTDGGLVWTDAVVVRDGATAPTFELSGSKRRHFYKIINPFDCLRVCTRKNIL